MNERGLLTHIKDTIGEVEQEVISVRALSNFLDSLGKETSVS